ncbi:hypothetical protein E2542_SST16554 [Spatholobus suberectus]|nr:hypothetical protein E2542_SST16554 [Spatholobus suberectus]
MGKQHLHDGRVGVNYDAVVVIKIPDARVLHVVSRSLLLAMALVALPFLGSILRGSVVSGFGANDTASGFSAEVLTSILRDLGEEGLLKKEDKVLIMGLPRVMDSDVSYDFLFARSFDDAVFADSILKVNGIVAFPLSIDPSSNAGLIRRSNYRVVYVRRVKKSALKGLADALLEPPRHGFAKSNMIKYLPELLGDSLEGYKRRVFIGVGLPEENRAALNDVVVPDMDVSVWLSKHVKEEEYVVMKAEVEVVLEMMKERTIYLVEELFLECNNEWWRTGKRKKSGRAYWECLALYGRLRDEGVVVHQWWD